MNKTMISSEIFQALSPELGEGLAAEVARMVAKTTDGNIEKLKNIFYAVGAAWAPLMLHWRNWLMQKSQFQPVLIMRDAKPLSVLPVSKHWPQAWLNRVICGIADELANIEGKGGDPLVQTYLEQEGLNRSFTFIDGGCWGTIVKELHDFGIVFQPLFFFSHNPNIPGFLNSLGVEDSAGEILNDSFECAFLNITERPTRLIQAGHKKAQPKLKPIQGLVAELGKATLQGLQSAAELLDTKPMEDVSVSIIRLLALSEQARQNNIFTGILHRNSPTWSEGQVFLDQWPKNLKWT